MFNYNLYKVGCQLLQPAKDEPYTLPVTPSPQKSVAQERELAIL